MADCFKTPDDVVEEAMKLLEPFKRYCEINDATFLMGVFLWDKLENRLVRQMSFTGPHNAVLGNLRILDDEITFLVDDEADAFIQPGGVDNG